MTPTAEDLTNALSAFNLTPTSVLPGRHRFTTNALREYNWDNVIISCREDRREELPFVTLSNSESDPESRMIIELLLENSETQTAAKRLAECVAALSRAARISAAVMTSAEFL